jgi:hypothetical protein
MVKKLIAALAVSASAALMVATPAHAVQRPTYQLTTQERHYACGNFRGTIIYSDNTSLDCSTGVATL